MHAFSCSLGAHLDVQLLPQLPDERRLWHLPRVHLRRATARASTRARGASGGAEAGSGALQNAQEPGSRPLRSPHLAAGELPKPGHLPPRRPLREQHAPAVHQRHRHHQHHLLGSGRGAAAAAFGAWRWETV